MEVLESQDDPVVKFRPETTSLGPILSLRLLLILQAALTALNALTAAPRSPAFGTYMLSSRCPVFRTTVSPVVRSMAQK